MKGALLCSLLASTATAHMQMMKPYPIRSPLNKDGKGQKDYSYTNPLQTSGSDYPCKGYAKDTFDSQATYQQGQSYTMELDGSATHDGGSCQLALTYDQGASFKVIESMLGDCPIAKKYDFEIPSDAPDGQALLAWTWFNKVGNREMYMNCAMVTIGGSSKGNETDAAETQTTKHKPNKSEEKKVSHPPMALAAHQGEKASHRAAKSQKQQASFDSLPALFVANVNQEGKCVTIEGQSVNFPKPGDNVLGKTDGKGDGYKCSGSAPFLASSKDASDSTSKDSKDTSDSAPKDSKDASDSTPKDSKDASDSTPKDSSQDAGDSSQDSGDSSQDSSDSSQDSSDLTSEDNVNSKVDKSTTTSTQDKGSNGSKTNVSSQAKTSNGSKTDVSSQAKTSTDSNQAKATDTKDSKTSTSSKDSNKNTTRSTPQSMSKVAQAFGTSGAADPRVVATDASTNNAFSSYVGHFTCTSGEIICSPDGYSWAMCANGAPVFMGSVAAGMTCRLGAMVAAPW